jgi:IPT/TIG domain
LRTLASHGRAAAAAGAPRSRRAGAIALLCSTLSLVAAPGAVAAAPTISAIAPNNGPAAGGSSVTIEGSGFLPGSIVAFGANAATDVRLDSANTITASAPAGAGTVDVSVTNANGASPPLPADQFAYDPAPHGPWLGLNGNSAGAWTGAIGDFTFHNVVYDRSGDPGIDWQAGELLEEGAGPTVGGAAIAESVAAGMIPDVTIEYGSYTGDGKSDPNFPAGAAQISSYVEGFVASARAIHEKYPEALFEPMNEPWFYTTPKYNGAEYANVIAQLLPAARRAGIPLQQIFIAAYGADRNSNDETSGGWVPAMYGAQPQLQTEIQGWYFHPYGPPRGSGLEKSLGIQSVAEVQKLMTSGQNNILVSEVGYCAPDVGSESNCTGPAAAENSTQAAAWLTEMLDNALPYREAGWLRALIVYSRADGGWAMQTPGGRLTKQGEALDEFADLHGLTPKVTAPPKPAAQPDIALITVSCLTPGEHDPFTGACDSG